MRKKSRFGVLVTVTIVGQEGSLFNVEARAPWPRHTPELIRLALPPARAHRCAMGLPAHPVTLSPQEVSDLNRKLSDARHNINNNLALVVASLELLRRKPDAMERVIENLSRQPQRIVDEIREFTERFEAAMRITRD